jgi:Ala-tRNA(Pro) deacylase
MSEQSVELVKSYLGEQGVDYELVQHEERFTTATEAQAAGLEPGDAAKDLILRDGDRYMLAVIPASERLDLGKARELLDASSALRLATEEEIGRDFERFDVGAVPPFGGLHGIPEVIDRRLLEHDRVLCSAGDHTHGVLVDPQQMVRVAGAGTGDLCQESSR